ncbi:MAG TPA: M13 family metallopeptidase, partial [Methanomicrobiales archaeon]|nr:M13 family metallopeptidase [Methanomicrobiales archaeon]
DDLGRIYIREYFNERARERMLVLIEDLRASFRERLEHLDWMQEATRSEALAKLDRLEFGVAYPEVWQDYASLSVKEDQYLQNVIDASRFSFLYGPSGMERAGKAVDRRIWYMTPQTVNAYYEPSLNEMVFPAAMMRPPFFSADADDAANYGGIGAVIGHEMTHGFDDEGRHYDRNGNLRDWWTAEDEREFVKRAAALRDQYSSYEALPGLHVNGALSLGENIADLGGLTVAYHAYKRTREGREDPDGDRRFFTSYARIWRENIRKEALRTSILSDPHSPPRYRVNVPLSNLDPFYAAFPEVKPGDPMYRAPEDRIVIW